jgi:hypothetical protein
MTPRSAIRAVSHLAAGPGIELAWVGGGGRARPECRVKG